MIHLHYMQFQDGKDQTFTIKKLSDLTEGQLGTMKKILSDREEFYGYYYASTPSNPKSFAEQGLLDDDKLLGNMMKSSESGSPLTMYVALDNNDAPAGHVACYEGPHDDIEIEIMTYLQYRGKGLMKPFAGAVKNYVEKQRAQSGLATDWYATFYPSNIGSEKVLRSLGISPVHESGASDIKLSKEKRSIATQTIITAESIKQLPLEEKQSTVKDSDCTRSTSVYCPQLRIENMCDPSDSAFKECTALANIIPNSNIGNRKSETEAEVTTYNIRVKASDRRRNF